MNCQECKKELRRDNKVGFCKLHRHLSPIITARQQANYQQNKNSICKMSMQRYYANKVKLEERSCKQCNTTFSPTRRDNIFCKRECGVQYWRDNNKEHTAQYMHNLYHADLNRRLSCCLRTRLRFALKGQNKSDSTSALLGCSIEELKKHLENQFQPGMTWNNWTTDGWHIDHIKPLSAFDLTNPEQLKEACNYINLQPLWAEDNLSKGDS